MLLKGLRVRRKPGGEVEVTPLYFSKRGGTMVARTMRVRGRVLKDVVGVVLSRLMARGDLAQ